MNILKQTAILLLLLFFTSFLKTYSQVNVERYNAVAEALADSNEFPSPPSGYDTKRTGIDHGKVTMVTYHSNTVGVSRQALIYTPPGYSEDKKYNVLYLLHGIGGDEKEWYSSGNPHNILDNLYADQKLEPMIVVFPNGRAMVNDDAGGDIYAADKIKAFETFEFDLLNDLIPFIDSTYPVLTDRINRAIGGLSMGGGQSLNFGLAHLNTFAWVASFSAAPNTKSPSALVPNPSAVKDSISKLWISCGTNDGLLSVSEQTHKYLVQHNIPHIYSLVDKGGHDWRVWKYGLYHYSQLLFKPSASAVDNISPVTSFSLLQNFPNPFNPTTTIIFQLETGSFVNIKVYDILGNEITTLVNGFKTSGRYEINFNASGLQSGVYFCRITAGTRSETKKMMLLK